MEEKKFIVSSTPHIKSKVSTKALMGDVIIALCPALIAGVYFLGIRALLITLVCVASCIVSEYLFNLLNKKPQSIGDLSAVVTGMLIALNMPITAPIWMMVIGCVFAIIIVKMIFGGMGRNFMNPALCARVLLMVSFPARMSSSAYIPVDATTSATPMTLYKAGEAVDISALDLLLGRGVYGSIGEICKIALIMGGLYLIFRRVISPIIPVLYLGSFALCQVVFGGGDVLFHLLSGGLLLGAFFMATDYVTSPVTNKGKVVYAVLLGALTFIFRKFGAYAEGVCFAILIMNALTPLIERFTVNTPFGMKKGGKKNEKAA